MDGSTIIAIVTAISSSVVTIAVSFIVHIAGLIKERSEDKRYYKRRRIETFEKYFEALFSYGKADETYEFCKISGIIHMYVNPDKWDLLNDIHNAKLNHSDNMQELAKELAESLSHKEFDSLSPRSKKNKKHRPRD